MRRGSKPAKAKVEAEIPAALKSRENEGSSVADLEKRLAEALKREAEALEQQTATADILRVISSSRTDAQPVFDAIVRSAVRLCDATFCNLVRLDGELLFEVAEHNFRPEALEMVRRRYPAQLTRQLANGRAILDRAVCHIPDVEDEPKYDVSVARVIGFRSVLGVPMFREESPIGAIAVARAEPGPFSQKQIELLQTFADQAVIAIENVRLFTELEARNSELTEALEQQTATGEILRVISSSPTDVQPVFDAIVVSAARLCSGVFGAVFRMDGELIDLAGSYNIPAEFVERFRRMFPARPHRGLLAMRAVLDGVVVQSSDLDTDAEFRNQEITQPLGMRSMVGVPMLRDGAAIGAITVGRRVDGPFPPSQIELLETFADQAVIAIENVRLFTELEARKRDLSEALERETATSEVLKVISRSTFDLQPVLETLVENATRLCGAEGGLIAREDGEVFRMVAEHGASPAFSEYWRRNVIRPGRGSVTARAALERRTVHLVDVLADREYDLHEAQRVGGYRSVLCVPMLRRDDLIGLFVMWRTEVRAFTDKQIELVTTFADQGVIAIENVRLLQELQARTAELGRSVDELTALGDVGRALSSTLDLETVLETIVIRATQLAGVSAGQIWEYGESGESGDEFRLRASHYVDARDAAILPGPGG